MKLRKKWFLPLLFTATATLITVPLISASCGFNIHQTKHNNDNIRTSKAKFVKLFGDNQNNYYRKFSGSNYEEDAKKNNLEDITYYYEKLLKEFVTIDDIENYARNYAWKWYFKDLGPKSVEFYLYSVPLEAIAKQDISFISSEKDVHGDWRLIVDSGSGRGLKNFKITLYFDEF